MSYNLHVLSQHGSYVVTYTIQNYNQNFEEQ